MSSGRFGVLELLAFLGIALGVGVYQLWSVRRETRRIEQAERAEAQRLARFAAATPRATAQGVASDERGSGAA